MAQSSRSEASSRPDNIGPAERWLSALAGLGLLLSVARGRGVVGRLTRGSAGLTLMARGATGYCPAKGALQGDSTVREGLQEQWRRLSQGMSQSAGEAKQRVRRMRSPSIESMDALYAAELQELHNAESQMIGLSQELMRAIGHSPLAFRVQEYGAELQSRRRDLESLLARMDVDRREHPDEAMQALIRESRKMASLRESHVRDAALAASLQRLIHYKIAGYGTIAAYAKALGRTEEAAQFAQLADRDQTIDGELSALAKNALNPEAVLTPQQAERREIRTH